MGDWYVQGHIPLPTEKNAYNAVESYYREESGKIRVLYAYRDGAYDASIARNKPTGFVEDEATFSLRASTMPPSPVAAEPLKQWQI